MNDRHARAVVVASLASENPRDKEVSELYAARRKSVRAYLINSVGCPEHEANDVVQDTILIVRGRWDQLRTLEKPAACWYKIAGRRARRLQGQRAKRGYGPDPHDLLSSPGQAGEEFTAACRRVDQDPGERQRITDIATLIDTEDSQGGCTIDRIVFTPPMHVSC